MGFQGRNGSLDETPAINPPRILIIGAGSRGNAYARAVKDSGLGIVAAVADPITYKRRLLGSKYIWGQGSQPSSGQEFESWQQFLTWETQRRKDHAENNQVPPGIDGVFICVLDEQHTEVVTALAPLNLHIMCEKPLATSLKDCLSIYKSLSLGNGDGQKAIFGIGHVLRYSPHNMLLRRLVLEDQIIGDVLSVEHAEPVGWWHFSHSYVRYVSHPYRSVDKTYVPPGATGAKRRLRRHHCSQSPATILIGYCGCFVLRRLDLASLHIYRRI